MTAIRHHRNPLRPIAVVLAAALLAACGPAGEADSPLDGKSIHAGAQALSADNGLSLNGLNLNGLNLNGLNLNGLNLNGLSTTAFSSWFNNTLATSPTVMWYLYACAAPLGSALSWTNPTTGATYVWAGVLGLAPDWVGGSRATTAEQQVISACLAAHVNKFGATVLIAVEGRSAKGVQIPILTGELTTFSVREACYFGNLFTGDGVFSATDHAPWSSVYSTSRVCGFNSASVDTSCPPMAAAGACQNLCTRDATDTFYESCTWNGKTYKPITTRLRPQEMYQCGDGVCQFTEHCGKGTTADSCKADCGVCK